MTDQKYERARRRVKEKREFYQHLSSYLTVIGGLFLLNVFTSPGGHLWFIYPALGWGIGLASHYFKVFGLGQYGSDSWEEREMEKELRRLNAGQEEEDYLDLPELKREEQPRKKWDDEDLV